MKILAYVARHGKTTDSDKNIFRGDRDSKLNRQGFNDAGDLQDFFKNRPFGTIFCSDMTRSIQTGHMIGEPHGKVPYVCPGLKPWDIGFLTGKDKDKFGSVMKHYIDNPEETPEKGESRNEFEKNRINPLLIEAMEIGLTEGNDPPLVVGHSSIIHALAHLLHGDGNHPMLAVKPGGVVMVYLENGEIKAKPILKKGQEDSSYSVDTKKQQPSS